MNLFVLGSFIHFLPIENYTILAIKVKSSQIEIFETDSFYKCCFRCLESELCAVQNYDETLKKCTLFDQIALMHLKKSNVTKFFAKRNFK